MLPICRPSEARADHTVPPAKDLFAQMQHLGCMCSPLLFILPSLTDAPALQSFASCRKIRA
jgi:hypothetical protein